MNISILVFTILISGALAACSASSSSPDKVSASSTTPRQQVMETVDHISSRGITLKGRVFYTATTSGDLQSMNVLRAGAGTEILESGAACCILRVSPIAPEILVLPLSDELQLVGATADLTTKKLRPLPSLGKTLNAVPGAYSPDGQRIAYEAWDDTDPSKAGIYTARATDSGDLVRLTRHRGEEHAVPLDYSPDGTRLLYFLAPHPDPDYTDGSLWVVNVDGSRARRVTPRTIRPGWSARWSPNGRRIVFGAERLARRGPIWTVRPDGSGLTTVYKDPGGRFAGYPDWSPDGSHLVFTINATNDEFLHLPNELYVIPAAGGPPQPVKGPADTFFRSLEWVG